MTLAATDQPIETSTAAGKCFLDMLSVFAEFETNLRKERQLEGIAAAKAEGRYKGRKPSIDAAAVRRMAPKAWVPRRSPTGSALAGAAFTGCSPNRRLPSNPRTEPPHERQSASPGLPA